MEHGDDNGKKSFIGFIVVVAVVGGRMFLSIGTAMSVYTQSTTMPPDTEQQNQTADPQQIKNYLTQVIQALRQW